MLEELDTRDACRKVRVCVEQVLEERERQVIVGRYGLDGKPPEPSGKLQPSAASAAPMYRAAANVSEAWKSLGRNGCRILMLAGVAPRLL